MEAEVDEDTAERKRRRDRLVKLHRYLGSNVPAGLVLGVESAEGKDLPAAVPLGEPSNGDDDGLGKGVKWWHGHQDSMSSVPTSPWGEGDREFESHLTEKDRALNIKRKSKMEQVRRLHIHSLS